MLAQSRVVLLLALFCLAAAPARGQDNGARVSGFFGGTFGEGPTSIGTGGAVGYRFSPHAGFDFQAVALPDLELTDGGASGRGVAFLTNFVAEFPCPARWLMPYVSGGGGVANISRLASTTSLERDLQAGRRLDISREHGNRVDARGGAETDVALTAGGGVDFRVWHNLSVGPNITYLRLFGSLDDRNLTQISGRATYRF
jgi:opacity protein-like surface antigen